MRFDMLQRRRFLLTVAGAWSWAPVMAQADGLVLLGQFLQRFLPGLLI